MSSYLPYLVTWMQSYGYPILWSGVFIAAIGLPIPTTLLLLATGAFAALGDFNIFLVVPLTLTASISGDSIGYVIGRRIGSRVLSWLEREQRFRLVSSENIIKARQAFVQRGGWAIFLTRFLFSALGGITNIIAGADDYPYLRFLAYDVCGEILGALIPLLLGYIFGASWEAIGDVLGATSSLLLALAAVVVLIVILVRSMKNMRQVSVSKERKDEKRVTSMETIRQSPDTLPL